MRDRERDGEMVGGVMDKSLLLVFVVPYTPAASLVPLQHLVVLSILDCRTAVSI